MRVLIRFSTASGFVKPLGRYGLEVEPRKAQKDAENEEEGKGAWFFGISLGGF
jgi:hypothetical protein